MPPWDKWIDAITQMFAGVRLGTLKNNPFRVENNFFPEHG